MSHFTENPTFQAVWRSIIAEPSNGRGYFSEAEFAFISTLEERSSDIFVVLPLDGKVEW